MTFCCRDQRNQTTVVGYILDRLGRVLSGKAVVSTVCFSASENGIGKVKTEELLGMFREAMGQVRHQRGRTDTIFKARWKRMGFPRH